MHTVEEAATIECHRLHQEHGSPGLQVFTRVARNAHRVTHVVETVEEADEVVGSRVLLRVRDREVGAVRDSRLFCARLRGFDRRSVKVETVDCRLRVRVRHHHDRGPVTAADVGDPRAVLQPLLDPVERRDPRRREERAVAGTEEPFGTAEQTWVMVTPTEPTIALVRSAELVAVGRQRNQDVHTAGHERRCRLVGEKGADLVGHGVAVAGGVVRHEPGRGLAVEPLASEPGIATDLPGQLVGADRTSPRHRPVVAQLVAEPNGEAQRGTRHVPRQLADQLLDTSLIDRHGPSLCPNRTTLCVEASHQRGERYAARYVYVSREGRARPTSAGSRRWV